MIVHDFATSRKVEIAAWPLCREIVRAWFGPRVVITLAHPLDDRSGIDFWATPPGRDAIPFQTKVRETEYQNGKAVKRGAPWTLEASDVLLEIESNDKRGTRGWVFDPESAFILYVVEPSRRGLILPSRALHDYVSTWLPNKAAIPQERRLEATNPGYKSTNIAVLAPKLERLINEFHGLHPCQTCGAWRPWSKTRSVDGVFGCSRCLPHGVGPWRLVA